MIPKPRKTEFTQNTSVHSETNVSISMRDNIVLRADIFKPAGDGQFPVLLSRIPYGKHRPRYHSLYIDPQRAVARGYAVVIQDVRGRHTSDGEFYPYRHEPNDGYDTVEWCAQQTWSNGDVGMFGMSYHGATQLLAATTAPPALRAIVPMVTSDSYFDSWTYLGGAFQLYWIGQWCAQLCLDTFDELTSSQKKQALELEKILKNPEYLSQYAPLSKMPAFRELADYYYDWLDHDTYDNYWKTLCPKEKFNNIEVPCLNIGGWYDGFLRGTVRCYEGIRTQAATKLARDQQHLLIGPWMHEASPNPYAGQEYFGIGASGDAIDLQGMMLAWFDQWLKGEDNGVKNDPKVYYFLMGKNEWRASDEWPPRDIEHTSFYLSSNGNANSAHGNGLLTLNQPDENTPPDTYINHPSNPVPTVGGAHLDGIPGIFDTGVQSQGIVESREDVLVYTSDTLNEDLTVAGNVILKMYAITSATDTDWTAKLCDVRENASSINICEGILRASYRDSLEFPEPVESGKEYEYELDLGPTAIVFKKGHRIRLQISSTNFPAYSRNSGTNIGHNDTDELSDAVQKILHDATHPSQLILPILSQ